MDRASQIERVIENNPGIKFREIMRVTGMKNGVLSHYTRKLEDRGTIVVERKPRLSRFFPTGVDKQDSFLISALRQETPKNIILALFENNSLSFKEIVRKVKRSPSTVSMYLTKLIQDEIIISKYLFLKRTFEIKNRDQVQKIIGKYQPNLFEKSADQLADIFNSL